MKLCRRTCQTRWLGTDGLKEISNNVEELVSQPLLSLTCARQFSFHGMGREDVDVRMCVFAARACQCAAACQTIFSRHRLDTGRPFVVELRDCRSPMALTQNALDLLYAAPSDSGTEAVSVINAHAATKAERDELVKAAGTSRKTYRCVVWAARVVTHDDLKVLEKIFVKVELQQMTPIRVLHRRTSAVRAVPLLSLGKRACASCV